MKRTRTLLAAAAAIAGLVAFAGPAQAVPPQAQTFTIDLPGTNEPGVGETASARSRCKSWRSPISSPPMTPVNNLTGFGSATVTNTVTGKTLKFNISGPGNGHE